MYFSKNDNGGSSGAGGAFEDYFWPPELLFHHPCQLDVRGMGAIEGFSSENFRTAVDLTLLYLF